MTKVHVLAAKTVSLRCVCAALLSLPLAIDAFAESVHWDMPTAFAPGNFQTRNIVQFAEAVRQASGDDLTIRVHSGASLYKASQIKFAVRTGQVPIGETLMALHLNENSLFGLDSIPFLATDYAAARTLSNLQRPLLEKILQQQGLLYLYSVPWPPQGLFSPKPITNIADIADKSFRAYSKQSARFAQLVAANPVMIHAAEVSHALVTDKIDLLLTSSQAGVDFKIWESMKYFYNVGGWLPKNMVIVSRAAFLALEPRLQDVLLAEAQNAERRGWHASERITDEASRTLRDRGIKFEHAGLELMRPLQAAGADMQREWRLAATAAGARIIDSFQTRDRKP